MADTIKLTFLTMDNEKISLSIRYPNVNVSDSTVRYAMSDIISSDVLRIKNAAPANRLSAELRTTEETPYSI